MKNESDSERNWVLVWAAAIVLLASVPYLWGLHAMPPGFHFVGLTRNIDDGAVYLSWMRQAADGSFFIRNLFTTDAQPARQFNLLFLAMGWLAGVTHLPLIWVYHIFRVGLGIALILAVWRFSKLFVDDAATRRLLIPLVGLSSGLGWLIPGAKAPIGSIDVWQPEAITFLSIYLNPLFLIGLILTIGSFYHLTLAHRHGSVKEAALAGVTLLVLGNIHTYDVLTVGCVWIVYLLVTTALDRRLPVRTILLSGFAALIAAPTLIYQFHLYFADPIFRGRVETPIPSAPILALLTGYGLILIGAIIGAIFALRTPHSALPNPQSAIRNPQLLLIVWAVIGFILPYAPLAQARKLLMGLHMPLCILCALALSRLLSRAPNSIARGLTMAFILFTTGSNIGVLSTDICLLLADPPRTVTHYQPFLTGTELDAMNYLRRHGDSEGAVLAPPTFALFTPAFTGRPVYCAHFSETNDYDMRFRYWREIINSADGRAACDAVCSTGVSYWVLTDEQCGLPWQTNPRATPLENARACFPKVFEEGGVSIFRVTANL